MKKVILVVLMILCIIGIFTNASAVTKNWQSDFYYANIIINKQMASIMAKDVHAYMETLYPFGYSEIKKDTYDSFITLTEKHDLTVDIKSVSFKKYVSDDELILNVIQSTYSIEPSSYNDNILHAVWTFKKYNGTWYFYSSRMLSIAYLE